MKRYATSALNKDKKIELSNEKYRAPKLYIEIRSRFFRTMVKTLTEAGYTKGRRGKFSQELILKK